MEKTFKRQIALIDTGIVYALSDMDDSWHLRARDFVKGFGGALVLPSTVIPESCCLLNTYLGREIERRFINSLLLGELKIEHFNKDDLKRADELLALYSDANIGFVDASLVAIAERLRATKIVTTDRRHFSMIKPRHCQAFTLLP